MTPIRRLTKHDHLVSFTGTSMGSPLRLTVGGSGRSRRRAIRAWTEVLDEFAASDAALSRFSETSELTELNRSAGSGTAVAVSRRLERAIVTADRARRVTGGRFDPRVHDDLEALGEHGADLGRRPDRVRPARAWRRDPIVRRSRAGVLELDKPLDLGGIGKGLALRWAASRVERSGIADFLLEAGGDIVVRGTPTDGAWWHVGIEDPSGGEPVAVAAPPPGAISTSSISKRRWLVGDRLVHHLLDPASGAPADRGLSSVTIAAPDPAWAEVWSKALFIGGRDRFADEARRRGLAAWWTTIEGVLEMTPAARAMTPWVRDEQLSA